MVGTLAGILTTIAFVPQVVKTFKTKDTSGLSLGMYSMQVLGILLWMIHGFMIKDVSLAGANVVTFCLAVSILFCKLKYK